MASHGKILHKENRVYTKPKLVGTLAHISVKYMAILLQHGTVENLDLIQGLFMQSNKW